MTSLCLLCLVTTSPSLSDRIRETVVEQEEAEAEVTHEKTVKMKEIKSVEELKSAELDQIKSEV